MSFTLYTLSCVFLLTVPFIPPLLFIVYRRADRAVQTRRAPLFYVLISTLAILSTLSGLLGLLDLKYPLVHAFQTSRSVLVMVLSCSVIYLISSTIQSEVVSKVALNIYVVSLSMLLLCGTVLTYTGHVAPVLPPLFYLLFSTATLPIIVYIILAQHCRFTSTSCRTPRFVTVIFPHDGREDVNETTSSTITVSPPGSCKKSYSLDNIPSPVTITFPSATYTRSQPLRGHSVDFPVRIRTRSGQMNEPITPPRTPTRVRTRTASSTSPRIMFPHQRMPSSSARSVASTLSLPRNSFKLSFWVYLLAAQISALLSQLFEVCHHALISSRKSETNTLGSRMDTNVHTFNFELVIPEVTDTTLVAMGFMANLTLVVSVGCVVRSLLLLAFLSTPTQYRHPHTRTTCAPSNHSYSPQSSLACPEPRKLAPIADDTIPTVSTCNLIAKSTLDLAPPPSPVSFSDKTLHISPWIPGTPTVVALEAPAARRQRQREGEERQLSTSSSFIRDGLSATPPTRQTHISMYLDELPVTPPLTKDDTRTPPSTSDPCSTPPSLANHIRTLTERQTTVFTRSHSHSSSFESRGVASLSMRIGHDPRFSHDNEAEDRYTIPPSPTPVTRKRRPIVSTVRVDVHEEVDVTRDIPPRPRTDSAPITPVRRRQPRPWSSEGRIGSEGSATRSASTFSAFFSSISVGRWGNIFHLGSGGHAGHAKSASQGSLRRADGFERLNEGDIHEKWGQSFSAPLSLDEWELELLELGLKPSSARSSTATITPPKRTKKSPACLDTQNHTPSSTWLSDPDPFAAPPRGAVTFVSSVKDRGVTRFGVGETQEDSQIPTRMSAWGKLVLPVPSPSQVPAVPPLPAIATGDRSIRRPSSTKFLKPASSAIPPLPITPCPPSVSPASRDGSFYYRPGLPRSFSTPDVREETLLRSPATSHPLGSTSSSHHGMPVEEALLAQRLLRKLNRDSRRTGKRGKSNGHGE